MEAVALPSDEERTSKFEGSIRWMKGRGRKRIGGKRRERVKRGRNKVEGKRRVKNCRKEGKDAKASNGHWLLFQ